ncbi:MAG: TonB-dependent receptor [Ignavibacteria bacterium]|nr:TonB-dependent receptor [Ignavibacteria bacterium]
MNRFFILFFILFAFSKSVDAQSVGKITGRIIDEARNESLPGVSILIKGTTLGAATDFDGVYTILNIKPGTYTLEVSYVGYATQVIQQVEVQFDKTTTIDVKLTEAVLTGEEVIVIAEKPIVQVDRTTTTAFVSSEKLNTLPVVSVGDAINLQAGVVDGHFRGGRMGEVAYLVNGVPINNAYSNSASFEIEQNMVSSLEVISGVFNAEYGQAMSGVVNIVTKDVPNKWSGSVLSYVGTVVSLRENEYVTRVSDAGNFLAYSDFTTEKISNFEAANPLARNDVQLSLGGPLIKEKLGIQLSLRYFKEDGYYYGRNLFSNSDKSFGLNSSTDSDTWVIGSNGDNKLVSYNNQNRLSLNAGLSYTINNTFKLDYNVFLQQNHYEPYSHDYKYVPNALNKIDGLSQNHIAGLRIAIDKNSFANISYSYLHDDNENRLYDTPSDSRYVSAENTNLNGQFAFRVSGNDLYSADQRTQTHTVVGDYTNQVSKEVQLKTGFLTRLHSIRNEDFAIRVINGVAQRSEVNTENNLLLTDPKEYAAYAQTKIEFKELIINAGLRFDYFDPNFIVPIDWGQARFAEVPNPDNPTELISNREDAPVSTQFSPRLGVAFPISATGVLRFSAGLFFQSPPFGIMYTNPEFKGESGVNAFFGNASLKPERTLSFEVGLQQGLTESVGVELTVYSKDIRNLATYSLFLDPNGALINQAQNLDYGTIKGITFALSEAGKGNFSWSLDYTLQFANGSASDPSEAFQRAQTGEAQIFRAQPLNWDRRHVINNSLSINDIKGFTISLINRYRTGTPYTTSRFDIISFLKNNASRPGYFTSDLRVFYKPPILKKLDLQFFLQVDNLTDSRPQWSVYNDTGVATQSFDMERLKRQGIRVGGLNSLEEFYYRQEFFGPPRRVNLGLKFAF